VPLVRRKIDHLRLARCALLLNPAADRCPNEPTRRRPKQQCARHVSNKARQHQENPADHGGKPRRLQIDGSNPVRPECAAKTVKIAPSGPPEHQEPDGCGAQEQQNGPEPADGERDQHKGHELRRREQENANKGPLYQGHRP